MPQLVFHQNKQYIKHF